LQKQVRSAQRPVHLLFLDESPAHHLVDGRFNEGRADRFSLPVALTVVSGWTPDCCNVGLELCNPRGQFLGEGGVIANQVEFHEQAGQSLQGFFDVAMPQFMF
jgi:hypothetical protein